MMIVIKRRRIKRRVFIEIEATPMSPASRALLNEFRAELRSFEKRWRELARAYDRETAGPTRASTGKKAAGKKAARPKRGR